jgi:hypothetical protein
VAKSSGNPVGNAWNFGIFGREIGMEIRYGSNPEMISENRNFRYGMKIGLDHNFLRGSLP